MHKDFFQKHPDPTCILDSKCKKIMEVNEAFVRFSGYSEKDLLKNVAIEDILYTKDLNNIRQRIRHLQDQCVRQEVRLLTKERNLKEIDVAITKVLSSKKVLYICSFHDITHQKEAEKELQSKLSEEKDKISETAKKILQLQQFLPKLKSACEIFDNLRNPKPLKDLLHHITTILCHKKYFGYSHACIFLVNGDYLEIVSSSKEQPLKRFHLKKQHRFALVARKENEIANLSTGEFVVAMESFQGVEGVLQVYLGEKERILLEESEQLQLAHENILRIIAATLGHSIRLQNSSVQQQPEYDPLTNLHTLKSTYEYIEKLSANKESYAIILFDIDQFSHISFPKQISLIQETALLFKQFQPEKSTVGYLGFDRFIVILKEKYSEVAVECAERLKKRIEKELPAHFTHPTMSGSVVFCDPKLNSTPDASWKKVIQTLHKAKNQGNSIFYWQQDSHKVAKRTSTKLH